MTDAITGERNPRKPLRLWPGIVAVLVQWLAWFIVPTFLPQVGPYGIFVGLLAGLAVIVWWLFFSRAPWLERIGVMVLAVIAVIAVKRLVHPSIAGGGMGFILYMYAVPVLSLALVIGAAIARKLSTVPRRAVILGALLLACGGFTLVRTGGITGEGDSDIHWRWTPTPEERLLAEAQGALTPDPSPQERGKEKATRIPPPVEGADVPAEWPAFRGPMRDGVVHGVRMETDWSKSPPVELWRRSIGPAWSSFAVRGDLFYTQEQRGEEEMVSCYRVSTGEPVWTHSDPTRFWESNAGAGPRATPTLHQDRVYTLGATGMLNALSANSGEVAWSRNAAADVNGKIPHWGFSGSPLVAGDLVIVYAGALAAYDRASGEPRWTTKTPGGSYSSPHLATIAGVDQILLQKGGGIVSVAPADGAILWEHAWQPGIASIVQPALVPPLALAEGSGVRADILITAADEMGGTGVRRIAVAHGPTGWTVEERWTSRGLKPYYNDFVVHNGHAYGFDNSILACIDLTDGTRKWKGGRYGHGQLLLLVDKAAADAPAANDAADAPNSIESQLPADRTLLLILSEEGELALVSATPDAFQELARFPAIEGKTWNHPVLAGDILLVRNDQEMAGFRLTMR